MYIYEEYDFGLFYSRFRDYNRLGQFPKGIRHLFEHLDSLAKGTSIAVQFDCIALCCEYSEISITEIERETGCESLDDLKVSTTVIDVDEDTIIYQVF